SYFFLLYLSSFHLVFLFCFSHLTIYCPSFSPIKPYTTHIFLEIIFYVLPKYYYCK
ncbi:hypothetical protein L9F63_018140, partial [Diploptera punctata]